MAFERILVNSFPKSGTHLLARAVENLGYREYGRCEGAQDADTPWLLNHRQAQTGRKCPQAAEHDSIRIGALTEFSVNPATLSDWLQQLKPDCYILGHLPFSSALPPLLNALGFGHIVILRDPRAVLTSLLHFIPRAHQSGMGAHFLAADFAGWNVAQQLDLLLDGGYAPKAGVEIQPFAAAFRSLAAWCDVSGCLSVRFEDLIGAQGGGDAVRQQQALRLIAGYLECKPNSDLDVYDSQARTFRQGQTQSWRKSLGAASANRIHAYCVKLCAELGYPL